jgi:hypothetical protein
VVPLEACGPLGLRVQADAVGLFGQGREEPGVAPAHLSLLFSLPKLLERVLADGLEHEEPVVADRLDEAVVDERPKAVELRIADFLGGFQWERAREDREPGEELAGGRVEEVVTPFDRRTQRPLALGRVAGTAGQESER